MLKKGFTVLAMASTTLLWVEGVYGQSSNGGIYTKSSIRRGLEYVPGRVVVGFDASVSEGDAAEIAARAGASVRRRGFRRAFRVLSVPRGRVWQTVRSLKRDRRVRYAHPDWIAHATQADPYYRYQWNFDNDEYGGIRLEEAWTVNEGGDSSVTVAVLDTGVAYENYAGFCRAPDLAETHFVPGWDFVHGDAHPNDDQSHGTHVTGTIAQTTGNGWGVAGIAPNTSIMPVKVLASDGSGSVSGIAEAIRWAVDNGANIINMSLGTSAPRSFLGVLEDAVRYAYAKGVLIVASSGNSRGSEPLYPARYEEVIAVGATKYNNMLTTYTNRGNEICAPGGTSNASEDLNGDGQPDMILQNTFNPGTRDVCDMAYWFFAGTSMSAPHVSGVAALIWAENPDLTHEEVRQILRDTADQSVDSACGFGLLDAGAALGAAATGEKPPRRDIRKTLHVADLFGVSRKLAWGFWRAAVYITIRDGDGRRVANAEVLGHFDGGPAPFRCTTNSNGVCRVFGYRWARDCLTFTVTDVGHAALAYQPRENRDLYGDSDGTSITVCR